MLREDPPVEVRIRNHPHAASVGFPADCEMCTQWDGSELAAEVQFLPHEDRETMWSSDLSASLQAMKEAVFGSWGTQFDAKHKGWKPIRGLRHFVDNPRRKVRPAFPATDTLLAGGVITLGHSDSSERKKEKMSTVRSETSAASSPTRREAQVVYVSSMGVEYQPEAAPRPTPVVCDLEEAMASETPSEFPISMEMGLGTSAFPHYEDVAFWGAASRLNRMDVDSRRERSPDSSSAPGSGPSYTARSRSDVESVSDHDEIGLIDFCSVSAEAPAKQERTLDDDYGGVRLDPDEMLEAHAARAVHESGDNEVVLLRPKGVEKWGRDWREPTPVSTDYESEGTEVTLLEFCLSDGLGIKGGYVAKPRREEVFFANIVDLSDLRDTTVVLA